MTLNHSLQVGLSFGLTSGVITTLGLIVGLASGTESKLAVIGGIITIAVADALSDALGIHVSEEAEGIHTHQEIWTSTLATFATKFLMALSFLLPVLLLDLQTAILVALGWGALAITTLSFFVARNQGENPWRAVFEHVVVGAIVVIATHYLGLWVAATFG